MILLVLSVSLLLETGTVYGQATGYPPFGSFQIGQFDGVNLQDLNANFAIPVIASKGRGLNLNLSIVYDSSVWQNINSHWQPVVGPNGYPLWGWKTAYPVGALYYTTSQGTEYKCMQDGQWVFLYSTVYSNFSYLDPTDLTGDFCTR